jgi:hypothetical protein
MKVAGQRIVFAALGILLLFWAPAVLVLIVAASNSSSLASFLFFLGGSLFLTLAVPGATLWIAGWIVEGFAKADPGKPSLH